MSDPLSRKLERQLKREGRLGDFLLEAVEDVHDPSLVAALVNKLSARLMPATGDLLILTTEDRIRVGPGETSRFQILTPHLGGSPHARIVCFRLVWVSDCPMRWSLFNRVGGRSWCTDNFIPTGTWSVPMAEDAVEVPRSSVLELDVSNEDTVAMEASFSMICRVQRGQCERCRGWGVIHFDGEQTKHGPGDDAVPCPACRPRDYESAAFFGALRKGL